jgi:hypothetical protein
MRVDNMAKRKVVLFDRKEPVPYATFSISDYKYSPYRIKLLTVVNQVWKDYLDGTISEVFASGNKIYDVMARPSVVSAEFVERLKALEDEEIFNDINYETMKDDLELFVDENNIASRN